jgi:hypothetical protein
VATFKIKHRCMKLVGLFYVDALLRIRVNTLVTSSWVCKMKTKHEDI